MIRFDNWQIKQEGGIIARQYDNLTRRLDVLGDFPEGWTWELLVQVGKKSDVIALSPTEEGVGVLLKASMLALGGQYAVQLRGTRGEQVRHTNILYSVYIPESLSGSEAWPEVPSAVEQALRRLEELNQHPPYPGDNGYWMVWDLDTNAYIESQLPLPPVAEGPPGKAATIEVGTTTTGDPGTEASVENVGTENAAVLNFTIPRGAVGLTGATPDISVQVSSLPAGSEPTVSVSGTPEAPVISLGIPAGQKGDPGTPGTNGTDGQTPNITIGTVETLPAGSDATASITGQTPNLTLNLGIPQGPAGDPGAAATITIGETITGAPGTQASVENVGTSNAAVLNFTIPQGESGAGGGSPAPPLVATIDYTDPTPAVELELLQNLSQYTRVFVLAEVQPDSGNGNIANYILTNSRNENLTFQSQWKTGKTAKCYTWAYLFKTDASVFSVLPTGSATLKYSYFNVSAIQFGLDVSRWTGSLVLTTSDETWNFSSGTKIYVFAD